MSQVAELDLPLPSHDMRGTELTDRPMVYAVRQTDGCIWIGWSKTPPARLRTHENDGSIPLFFRPGSGHSTDTDEDRLHRFFDRLLANRAGSKSAFRDDGSIEQYIDWLLESGYAADNIFDALRLEDLPFEVWSPQRSGEMLAAGGGQILLFKTQPAGRRQYPSRHVHMQSKSDEWLTPPDLMKLVDEALDGIDTDPASNLQAQQYIQARIWYSKNMSGLSPDHPWRDHVWLNPPYGRGENRAIKFVERLICELDAGTVTRAITCLSLNSMSSLWFDAVWNRASLHLVWRDRVVFMRGGDQSADQRKDASKGSVFSYFGDDIGARRFVETFKEKGHLIPGGRWVGPWPPD